MFIGEYSHSIDSKGRINVPVKFRRRLTEGVVVTRGLDRCLWLYPHDQWEQLAARLVALPLAQQKSRAFSRLMLAGASDTNVDKQGRIMIPEYLRDFAHAKKHIAFIGVGDRMEIWDEDVWNRYKTETEENSDSIAESMSELGI